MTGRVLRQAIDDAITEGATIEEVEELLLDPAPVSEDTRDALWLYAWGSLERQRAAEAA